jgi:hypothetical protein
VKPVYSVKKDGEIIALIEEKSSAYQLRNEKRGELPDSCHISADKQMLFEDLADRERLRS